MNTILFTDEEKLTGVVLEDAHPLEYVHARNYQFENIKTTIGVQKSYQQTNGVESAYLSTLFSQYKNKHEAIQNKRIEQMKYLNPNHYDTILQDPKRQKSPERGFKSIFEDVNSDEEGVEDSFTESETRENEKKRDEFYKAYVEGNEVDGEEVIGTIFERNIQKGERILYSVIEKQKNNDPELKQLLTFKKEWLKELNSEMEQIKKQNNRLKKKISGTEVCQNMNIISKLAPSIFSQYHVYFDDIFDLLMDDILTEEVEYLNESEVLEQKRHEEKEKTKHLFKMKELIRNQQLSTNLFGLIDCLEGFAEEDDRYDL